MSVYHRSLTLEKWRDFDLTVQILNVAAEIHRASNALRRGDPEGATFAYARAMELLDLTVATNVRKGLLRELLRWRTLVAEEYLSGTKSTETAQTLLKALLLLSAPSAKQIPYLRPPNG